VYQILNEGRYRKVQRLLKWWSLFWRNGVAILEKWGSLPKHNPAYDVYQILMRVATEKYNDY